MWGKGKGACNGGGENVGWEIIRDTDQSALKLAGGRGEPGILLRSKFLTHTNNGTGSPIAGGGGLS